MYVCVVLASKKMEDGVFRGFVWRAVEGAATHGACFFLGAIRRVTHVSCSRRNIHGGVFRCSLCFLEKGVRVHRYACVVVFLFCLWCWLGACSSTPREGV